MIAGEKVRLRAIERDDLLLLHAFNNDLSVELAGGGDAPMPQSLARLEAEFDQQASGGGRDGKSFAIEAHETFIGICVLFNENNLARTVEVGIGIGNKLYWGKGFGREALSLLVNYAFRYHNYHKVWLQVHSDNQRAIKAYTHVGFVEEGWLRQHVYSNGRYVDLVYMGILRSEWQTD